ncbi:hypothetical protein VHEMI03619 [[Torrubiella] hemipterigena]|uniref:AB hydrolase-1 domain-containing protein n=1 Tax=[Torrubiella] hemipterigena TaxID=1531966 RepID=A0A0A1TBE4_9HYPO|nr:hypothetical protein VHEMI03619 [[Torrubiella] hemipterigena]
MIKHQVASTVLQATRASITTSLSKAQSAKMTTADSSLPPPQAKSFRPEDVKQNKPENQPAPYFPMPYRDAAYQWWSSVTPAMAQSKVMSLVPVLKEAADSLSQPTPSKTADAIGTRVWRSSMVQLSGKDRALNEVCIERVGEEAEETLVMVHGYGAGLGLFYRNFEPVTRLPGWKLYALDMLGMGNSSRPKFKIHAKSREDQVIEAESFFIDALEEWRKARNIERFTLLGHSLGGYLAVSYALKYPGHLKKLILASPVGIPEDPYAVSAAMPEPGESTLENEFTKDQQTIAHVNSSPSSSPAAPRKPLPSWLVWLWDANFSPFSFVRMSGPLGPRLVSGWTSRRFNHLPGDEPQTLHDYAFSIFKQRGSGEYALGYILAPGAYARRPVIDRIHQVGRQPLPQTDTSKALKETGIPIVFMYGENDWMDVAGGLASEVKINRAREELLKTATAEEKRNDRGSARVVVIPKSGHHLYLDNPDDFNKVLREEMEDTMRESKRLQS